MPPVLTPSQAAHVERLYRYLSVQRAAPDDILQRFREVPRHWFVETLHLHDRQNGGYDRQVTRVRPDCEDAYVLESIYVDLALCIQMQKGICTSSTSQPSLMAQMMGDIDLRPGARVLEIGTATGWNAALMSGIIGPDGHLVTVEVDALLAEQAARHLAEAGYGEAVRVVCADGFDGAPAHAPYDGILATFACPEVPRSWLGQLAPGGRLVLPLALPGGAAPLLGLRREGDGWRGRFLRWSWFVEARGPSWDHWPAPLDPHQWPPLRELLDQPAHRRPLPWGRVAEDRQATGHFQLYLLLAAADAVTTIRDGTDAPRSGGRLALHDDSWSGVGVLGDHDVIAHGDPGPADRLVALAEEWIARGAPRLGDWRIEVDGDSPLVLRRRQANLAFR